MVAKVVDLTAAVQAIKKAPAASFSVTLGQGAKFRLAFHCADGTDATALQKGGTDLKPKIKAVIEVVSALAPPPPEVKSMLDDVGNTLDFRQSGPTVTASVQLSEESVGKLEKMLEQKVSDAGGGDEGQQRRLPPFWQGIETRGGKETDLEFHITNQFGECVKVDHTREKTKGDYKLHKDDITLYFSDVTYKGHIVGATMSGEARTGDGKEVWKWTVKTK
jgi:hypothetical protein